MVEVYQSMVTGYIIGAIIGLIVNALLSRIPAKWARDKGYSYGGFWCLSFFLSFVVGLIVAACITDRNTYKSVSVETKGLSYGTNSNDTSSVPRQPHYNKNFPQSTSQRNITNIKQSKKLVESLELSYSLDVEVQITKAELLLDSAVDELYLKLDIYNVSNKNITFLDLKIECFDTVGDKLGENHIVEYSYMNVLVRPQESFKQVLIKLNDARVRNVKVVFKKLLYGDGEVVRYTGEEKLVTYEDMERIDDLPFDLYDAYKECVVHRMATSSVPIKYFPKLNADGTWTCCCARKNTFDKDKCCLCSRGKQNQFDYINKEFIEQCHKQQKELKEKQQEESRKQHEIEQKAREEARRKSAKEWEERIRLEQEMEAKKKKIKILVTIGVFVSVCLVVIILKTMG